MRCDLWLKTATAQLTAAEISTARLDCLVLLEDILARDRAHLLAHPEYEISTEQQAALKNLLTRRAGHEPLAYIRGRSEFYGRDFIISSSVLVPRPESEVIIELLLGLIQSANDPVLPMPTAGYWRIADVGAGSGALGITAALELPSARVELLEISQAALAIANMNVVNMSSSILVTESDLLSHSTQANDILLCNLPYVPDAYPINKAATHEPKIALFGGNDGLSLYRELFTQINNLAYQPLYILSEALPETHDQLAALAAMSGYSLQKTDHFGQLFSR